MTSNDFRRVESWLYSIPRIEIALEDLKLDLERLDSKAASPPRWISNPKNIPVSGGEITSSRQLQWMEFIDEYQIRRGEITEKILHRQQQLTGFERVMKVLGDEDALLTQLVRKKYIEKVKPDLVIWETVIFVGKTKFYEMRRYIVTTFYECLPGQFKERTKGEPKSA